MILLDGVLVLGGGYLASRLAELLKLPGIVGMLAYGIVIGPFGLGLLSPGFQELAPDISVTALVIVIVSSFFAIDIAVVRRDAITIGAVGVVPGLLEGFVVMAAAVALLGFSWVQGGILGFTIAVVSPAVVVPTMIRLKEEGWGMDKSIPVLVLSVTNLDGLVAIILWMVFMAIEVGRADVAQVVGSSVGQIILGALWGWILAYAAAKVFDRWSAGRSLSLWVRTGTVLIASAVVFGTAQLIGLNAPAALLMFGLVFVNTTTVPHGDVGTAVGHIWVVASIVLFVLIGSLADLDEVSTVLVSGIAVIAIGILARLVGAMGTLAATARHLSWRERFFVGISTVGKATVQATLAPLVVAAGVVTGNTILAVAVLAIIVMAPVGAMAIKFTYRRLLVPPQPDPT